MIVDYFADEAHHKVWFKKEQGKFLKEARRRAGLSVRDVAKRTGVDIRWVERGEVNLSLRNLTYLTRLYRVSELEYLRWQSGVSAKLRAIAPARIRH